MPIIIALVVVLLFFIVVIANIKIVPQAHAFVLERLGAFHASWGTGLHVKIPFFDRIAKKVSLKEQVIDFPPQPVITKDNVTMQIDTVVYFQITDPKLYAYGVENPISAIENLSATTLRNIIGDMELDHTLTSRDVINSKIRVILDEATDAWGIKVANVEIKHVDINESMVRAIARQAEAERERRAKVIHAEGELQASEKLMQAAEILGRQSGAMQLRYMQTLSNIASDKNSTIVFPLPVELLRGIVDLKEPKA